MQIQIQNRFLIARLSSASRFLATFEQYFHRLRGCCFATNLMANIDLFIVLTCKIAAYPLAVAVLHVARLIE